MLQITDRVCFSCKIEKPIENFYKSNVRFYQRECKDCNRERKNKSHKTDEGKLSSANTKLKRRFGITNDDYNQMYNDQNKKCLICGESESANSHRLAVDHCHESGKIRGLLCKACNVALGNFKDSIDNLKQAILYLEKSKGITK